MQKSYFCILEFVAEMFDVIQWSAVVMLSG